MSKRAIVGCVLLCLLLAVPGLAQGQDKPPTKPETDTPPPGVTVEVLGQAPAPPPEQGTGDQPAPGQPAAAGGQKDEPKIELAYDGVPLAAVLKELGTKLKVLIVCDNERVLKTRVWAHMTVPESRAIMMITTRVFRIPIPARILCKPEEVIETDKPVKVSQNPLLNVKLEDAVLKDALAYLAKKTETGAGVTASLADKELTFEAKGVAMDKLMEDLAQAAECVCTTGLILTEINMDAQVEQLEKMSDEELEKMFSKALKDGDVQRGMGDMDPDQMQSGMQDGIKMFQDLDAAERKGLVERAVGTISRFNGILGRLSPETRGGLRSAVQPFMGLAMGGYFSLDPQSKAELAPIMKSLGNLKW